MKKAIRWAIVGLLSIALVGCGTTPSGNSGKSNEVKGGTIKFGIVGSMTGPGALSGESAVRGATLAIDEINTAGGVKGQKLELVVEDDQTTNEGVVSAYQKISSSGVVAATGISRSTMVLALMPYMAKYKIPVLVGGTNVTITQKENPWVFRFRPSDGISAKVMAKFLAEDLKAKKVAILYDTDAFGTGGKNGLEEAFKPLGVESQSFGLTSHSTDFTAQLVKIKQYAPDAIATYITYSEDAAVVVRQAKEMGMNIPFMGSPSLTAATTVKLAKDTVNGAYGVADYFPEQNEVANSFNKKYKEKYKDEPDFYSAFVYDAVKVAAQVMEKKGTTPEQLADGLREFKGWTGTEGEYEFDKTGEGLHAYTVVQVANGVQKMVKVVKVK